MSLWRNFGPLFFTMVLHWDLRTCTALLRSHHGFQLGWGLDWGVATSWFPNQSVSCACADMVCLVFAKCGAVHYCQTSSDQRTLFHTSGSLFKCNFANRICGIMFFKREEACSVALGFSQFHWTLHSLILGWICWDVHSWREWQTSWIFSTFLLTFSHMAFGSILFKMMSRYNVSCFVVYEGLFA